MTDAPELVRGYVKGLGHAERLEMLKGELHRGVAEFHDPNRYRTLLRFIASQPRRSFRNQMLIYLQRPSAPIALGKGQWMQRHKQRIKAEEFQNPIWIYAPVHAWVTVEDEKTGQKRRERRMVNTKPVSVYAQDQVEGPPLPTTPTMLRGEPPREIWENLTRYLASKGYTTKREAPHIKGADGETDPVPKIVRVEPAMTPMSQLATLGHEAFHVELGHVDDMEQYRTHHGQFEIECEAATFLFFAAHSIEIGTASFEYLDFYAKGDAEVILKSAERAVEGAQGLLDAIYGKERNQLEVAPALSPGLETPGLEGAAS